MKVKEVHYNWEPSIYDGKDLYPAYTDKAIVGKNEVVKIMEERARGEGDKWTYLIEYSDKRVERVFNPNKVIYECEV